MPIKKLAFHKEAFFHLNTILKHPYSSQVHPQLIIYADNIEITATHSNIETAKYTYNYTYTTSTLGPSQTTCKLFTPDTTEYNIRLNLHINNTILDMYPNILDLTLDSKLTNNKHIDKHGSKGI